MLSTRRIVGASTRYFAHLCRPQSSQWSRLPPRRPCSSHAPATPTTQTPPFQTKTADHRDLGVHYELFTTSIYSPGSPILLPNGARMFNRLVDFLRKQYVRYGFDEVITPTIYKKALWEKSGHLENYSEDMFTVTSTSPSRNDGAEGSTEDEYGLKPMNCPGHCLIFASQRRSYRDLPIRYADFSPLHRNELSGALSGLTRVRRFHQDDGHIFCRPTQIEEEIRKTLDFVRVVYKTLGLGPYRLALSTRPADHYIGTEDDWNGAENSLKRALEASGQEWTINEGDGAFYGPKIDIILRDSDAKEHQTATIQLDFQLPKRFELEYQAPAPEFERKGEVTIDPAELANYGAVTPVLIHRAVLGSVERLMALLIEHYNGEWPFWLNPRQAIVLKVNDSEEVVNLARSTQDILLGRDESPSSPLARPSQLTCDIDNTNGTLGYKVRTARSKRYGVIIVVGPKQISTGTVSVQFAGSYHEAAVEMDPRDLRRLLQKAAETYADTPSDPPPDYESSTSTTTTTTITTPSTAAQPPAQRKPPMPPPPAPLDLPILQYMRTHRTILASASPRRRQMLAQLGVAQPEVRPSRVPEDLAKTGLSADEYVAATAQRKALDAYAACIEDADADAPPDGSSSRQKQQKKGDPDLVIAADTVIATRDGLVLEKPASEAAHRQMLRHLRDTRSHRVLTAVCCVAPRADARHPGYSLASATEESRVVFAGADAGLGDDVLDAYVRTREGADKAGGYAVQGVGGMLLVERVEGAVDNVVGLPVRRLLQLCEKVVFKQADDEEGSGEGSEEEEED
ncbi:threonyl-tRNA synthetase-like protein [Xylariomycetidae sp. FL0641]|nr:threonyl-tRNA synthetase-like protein [Xylariomycetidae sp. FL0641]